MAAFIFADCAVLDGSIVLAGARVDAEGDVVVGKGEGLGVLDGAEGRGDSGEGEGGKEQEDDRAPSRWGHVRCW